VAREKEELRLVARDLLVVVADPVDRDAVAEVLRTALDHPDEGEDAEHVQRGKDGESEHVECSTGLRCLADETERDQCAGDRQDVEGGSRSTLACGLRPGPLEGEVLSRESSEEFPTIRRLGHGATR
jgi:hypothetical protein